MPTSSAVAAAATRTFAAGAGFTNEPTTLPGYSGKVTRLDVAVAVAMAESGGNPTATNQNTNGSTDRGLWQINSIHLGRLKVAGNRLYDPTFNAQVAFDLSKGGTDWTPWVAYKSGRAGAWLTANPTAAGGILGAAGDITIPGTDITIPTPGADDIPGVAAFAGVISDFFGALLDAGWWKRVLLGAVGAQLVGLGIVLIAGDTLLSTKTGSAAPSLLAPGAGTAAGALKTATKKAAGTAGS